MEELGGGKEDDVVADVAGVQSNVARVQSYFARVQSDVAGV